MNTYHYSFFFKLLHWCSAILVIFLFFLGLWMRELDYYHPLYQTAPHIHKSAGIVFILLTTTRLIYKTFSNQPVPLQQHSFLEQKISKIIHWFFYLSAFILFISGYLISTADGQDLVIFHSLSIPSLVTGKQLNIDRLEQTAGIIHQYLAYAVIALAFLHIMAVLKHHFMDKDATFKRMWFKQ